MNVYSEKRIKGIFLIFTHLLMTIYIIVAEINSIDAGKKPKLRVIYNWWTSAEEQTLSLAFLTGLHRTRRNEALLSIKENVSSK